MLLATQVCKMILKVRRPWGRLALDA